MPRPKLKESEKKIKIRISLDKSVHQYMKLKGLKISTTINQLLKVAYFNDSTLLQNNSVGKKNSPAQIRTAVNSSKGSYDSPLCQILIDLPTLRGSDVLLVLIFFIKF